MSAGKTEGKAQYYSCWKSCFSVYKIQSHFKTTRMKTTMDSDEGNPPSHALSPSA